MNAMNDTLLARLKSGLPGTWLRSATPPPAVPGISLAEVDNVRSRYARFETALARLRSSTRIALLHYAPVAATVQGEPLEIFPFLGSTRLEEPLSRYDVAAVFHGHAHHGQPEGRTSKGAPVFNVSLPLLQRISPERPFRHFDAVPFHN
jgi:hypothetical protein